MNSLDLYLNFNLKMHFKNFRRKRSKNENTNNYVNILKIRAAENIEEVGRKELTFFVNRSSFSTL